MLCTCMLNTTYRAALEASSGPKRRLQGGGGSVSRSFTRSFVGGSNEFSSDPNRSSGKRLSFRVSF